MTTPIIRVQEKGQVTIPQEIRERLGIKKGDLVVFIETEQGVILQSAEIVVRAALDSIGDELKQKGIGLEQLLKRGREIRSELIKEEYGLGDDAAS